MSFTQFKLENSPTAEECRSILGDLPTAKEKRKGKSIYFIIYFLLMACGGASGIFLPDLFFDNYLLNMNTRLLIATPILISSFLITVIFLSRESKLLTNNKIGDLINFIQPSLKEKEHFLAIVLGNTFGNAIGHINLDWIPEDINRYSYFIFTTDRLIVITFKPLLKTTDNILDSLATNTFEDNIQHVYTCSLADKTNVKYGGLVPHPLAVFTWTAIRVTPVKQIGMHTWFLEDKHTANGKMIKTIFKRLSNKRKF